MSIEVSCSCGGFHQIFPEGSVGKNEAAYAAFHHGETHRIMGQGEKKITFSHLSEDPLFSAPVDTGISPVENASVQATSPHGLEETQSPPQGTETEANEASTLIPLGNNSLFGNKAFVVVPKAPEQ